MVAPAIIQRVSNFIRGKFFARGTPLAGSTPRERYENMSIDPAQRSRFSGRSRGQTVSEVQGALAGVIPGGSVARRAGTGFINISKRAYGRLYSPLTLKSLGSAVTGSIGAGLGFGLTKYAFTGNPRDLLAGPQAFAGLLGFRTSPIAGTFGAVQGLTDVAISNIKNLSDTFTPQNTSTPLFQFPDLSNFNPAVPSASYTGAPVSVDLPSSTTNVSVMGGGGGDTAFGNILFAILASGGLGYLFGRRKRKRKRYKARRSRK